MKRRVTQLEVGPPEGRVASRDSLKKFLSNRKIYKVGI